MTVTETYKLEQDNKQLKEKLESSDEYGNEMAEIVQKVREWYGRTGGRITAPELKEILGCEREGAKPYDDI